MTFEFQNPVLISSLKRYRCMLNLVQFHVQLTWGTREKGQLCCCGAPSHPRNYSPGPKKQPCLGVLLIL